MDEHPDFYDRLLQRQLDGDPTLTYREYRELDLHLLICPRCTYYVAARMAGEPLAAQLRARLRTMLTAERVTPYMEELAAALHAQRPLSGFQGFLWDFIREDRRALGRFRLVEAVVGRRRGLNKPG
mgnify:CR=1 FL=1